MSPTPAMASDLARIRQRGKATHKTAGTRRSAVGAARVLREDAMGESEFWRWRDMGI